MAPAPLDLAQTLASYSISVDKGFVHDPPLPTSFQSEALSPWRDLALSIPSLLANGQLRAKVDALPLLSPDLLVSIEEYRLAYIFLSHLCHAYIWVNPSEGDDRNVRLPPGLALPLQEIAGELDVQPGITYAAGGLWNYKDSEECICTFTGTPSETHFNLTSHRVERAGGKALQTALTAAHQSASLQATQVVTSLQEVATALDECRVQLAKMRDGCIPSVFWEQIRPFLRGGQSIPKGVYYPSADGKGEYLKLSGATAGQSSLFQALDIILGVEHPNEAGRADFVKSMRKGMPGDHSRFLEDLKFLPSIRTFVQRAVDLQSEAHNHSHSNNHSHSHSHLPSHITQEQVTALREAYDSALLALKRFRDEHFKIVALFVIGPASREKAQKAPTPEKAQKAPTPEKALEESGSGEGIKGTGGSDLASLLKGLRKDTEDAKLGDRNSK